MSLEIIQIILAEEKQAAAALQEAQQSANDTVKNAESAVLDQERKAAVDNRALYQKLMEEKRAQVERELAEKRRENLKKIDHYIKISSGNVPKAIDFIVGEVINGRR
jgi:vacuolar-type H+-ATPase subunit H